MGIFEIWMPDYPYHPMFLVGDAYGHLRSCLCQVGRSLGVRGTKPWDRWPTAGGHRQEDLASLTCLHGILC